jgi:hypothetical protein
VRACGLGRRTIALPRAPSSPAVGTSISAVVNRSRFAVGTVDARRPVMRDLQSIETNELTSVTGGMSFNLNFPLPQLPPWLGGQPFKIPAADPPGHTKQYRQPTTTTR